VSDRAPGAVLFHLDNDDELALMVAIEQGHAPRASDPLSKALKARGLVQCDAGAWSLTEAGASYLMNVGH
jgi:hypothetical protein